MRIFKLFIPLYLMLNYTTCYSQDIKMNKDVEELIILGKDSIVQLAVNLLDDRAVAQNFTNIKVMTDGTEVYISFRNPIKYLPIKSIFYFDAVVSLIEKTTSYSPVSNGMSDYNKENIPFYKETEEIKMTIQFVIDAINNSDEVGSIDTTNFKDDMIILEHEKYYDISVVSEFQESSYRIEKLSGKISDTEHAHLEASPFESENKSLLKEIK